MKNILKKRVQDSKVKVELTLKIPLTHPRRSDIFVEGQFH